MTVRRSFFCVLAVLALLVAWVGCASSETRLSDRGLSPKDRREYIAQIGYGLPKEEQQAFIEGRLVRGMSRDMVLNLFGRPDRSSDGEVVWEYVNRRGFDIVGVRFKNEKIDQIYGDPFGRTKKLGSSSAATAPPSN